MLYYDRLDLREESNVAESNRTKNIWFVAISFSIMGLNLKIVSVMVVIIWKLSLNFSVTAIITVKNIDYYCVTHDISKPEAIHLLEN